MTACAKTGIEVLTPDARGAEAVVGAELLVFFINGVAEAIGPISFWTLMSCKNGCADCAEAADENDKTRTAANGHTVGFPNNLFI